VITAEGDCGRKKSKNEKKKKKGNIVSSEKVKLLILGERGDAPAEAG